MKQSTRTLVAALAVAALAMSYSPASAKNSRAHEPSLAGTWRVHVDLGFVQFPALWTFHRGGTFTSSFGIIPPGFTITSAHGIWRRVGPRTFEAVRERFNFVDGELASTVRSTNRLLVNRRGRQFKVVESKSEVILPDGEVLPGFGNASVSGSRMTFEH